MIYSKKRRVYFLALVAVFAFVAYCMVGVWVETGPLPQGASFIAHRGLSSKYYENTVAAFEGAGQSSFFYGIETDVRLTADEKFVCAHDNTPFLNRAVQVNKITLEEALSLPLRNRLYKMPTLEEYLDVCVQYNKVAVIELKTKLTEEQTFRFIELIKSKKMVNGSIIISFIKPNIVLINELFPELSVQVLYSTGNNLDYNYNLSIRYGYISVSQIAMARARNREIGAWTVNNKQDIRRLIQMGVNFITTDYDYS